MATSVTVLAQSHKENNHDALVTHLTVQGERCTGSVGCSC